MNTNIEGSQYPVLDNWKHLFAFQRKNGAIGIRSAIGSLKKSTKVLIAGILVSLDELVIG